MAFLRSLNISGSALSAQKLRMDVIAQNIANANTTRTEEGGPYIRKQVILAENDLPENGPNGQQPSFEVVLNGQRVPLAGVRAAEIVEDQEPLKPVYDPSHPDANEYGYVMMPNVDTVKEMVEMISATRSYEANVTALNAIKLMAAKALEIGK